MILFVGILTQRDTSKIAKLQGRDLNEKERMKVMKLPTLENESFRTSQSSLGCE